MSIKKRDYIIITKPLSPEKQMKQLMDRVSNEINEYFVGPQSDEFNELLVCFGFLNAQEFFDRTITFFNTQIGFQTFSLKDIESIDFKKMAYQYSRFIWDGNQLATIDQIKKRKDVASKFARIILFEYLFPALNNNSVGLAIDVHKRLEQLIIQISNIEGFNEEEIFTELKFDSLTVLSMDDAKGIGPIQPSVSKIYPFLWTGVLPEIRLNRLAKILHSDCNPSWIKSQKEFLDVFESTELKICRWNPKKIEHLARLIYCLYRRENKVIKPTKGGAFWDTTQTCFVDYLKNPFPMELKKISSRINRSPDKYTSVIEEVDEIIIKLKN